MKSLSRRQMSVMASLLLVLSLALGLIAAAPVRYSAAISTGTWYSIVAKHSGKCVDARSAATANGTVVQQYTCNSSNAQQYQFQLVSGNTYRVGNRNNSNQLLDIAGQSTADGGLLQLWANNGQTNQQWTAVSEGGIYYHFVNVGSGKCLDVPGGSTADSVQMQQWSCNGNPQQSFSLTVVGGAATATPIRTPTRTPTPGSGGTGNFPTRFTAPYVETWNNTSVNNLANTTGNKFWTLAFMLGSGCSAAWNGTDPISNNTYLTDVNNLRAQGGDVIISFGGASGNELGQNCTTVSALQAAYQSVITKYNLKIMDMDIEGGRESDTASVTRRNQALRNLQVANPGLRVHYTLAVDRTGLPQAQINLLNNAKANGVVVSVVNIMAMDYGPCYTDMGQAAIDAANATRSQLAANGISASVGVTPMIGVNDVTCENFTTSNMQQLVNYAQSNSYITLLAYWAQGADPNRNYINIAKTFH